MELLTETKVLIERYLEKVRLDPEHRLNPIERYAIYNSLEPTATQAHIQRMQQELDLVKLDPTLDIVTKAFCQHRIYEALAPSVDLELEHLLEQELAVARQEQTFTQSLVEVIMPPA